MKKSDIVNHNIDSSVMTWCSVFGILKSDLGVSGYFNTDPGVLD
jgi:hypothetical protein